MKKYIIGILMLCACTTKEQPSAKPEPADPANKAASSAPAQAPAATLTRVADPSTVCMVNDQDMGSPQIPVQVDGKTYYGCCKMCEKRLQQDESARTAIDPVSQQKVDKAVAVIARDASGKVFYFADETSLNRKLGKI